jgi:hypothetical protein
MMILRAFGGAWELGIKREHAVSRLQGIYAWRYDTRYERAHRDRFR